MLVYIGTGLLNSVINKLPFELHIPGYNFCGPGTRLQKRLLRGDKGVNQLDEACKQHDIAYSNTNDLSSRRKADRVLAQKAFRILRSGSSSSSSLGEKAAALGVASVMTAKTKLGMGMKRKKGSAISFQKVVSLARRPLKRSGTVKNALKAAKIAVTALKDIKKEKIKPPSRVIPVPRTGGFLPLIPLFAGLSALGALGGGAAGIAKAVNDAKAARKQFQEAVRHNKTMEAIAMGKGMYLAPYRKGMGMYLRPYQKKNC